MFHCKTQAMHIFLIFANYPGIRYLENLDVKNPGRKSSLAGYQYRISGY